MRFKFQGSESRRFAEQERFILVIYNLYSGSRSIPTLFAYVTGTRYLWFSFAVLTTAIVFGCVCLVYHPEIENLKGNSPRDRLGVPLLYLENGGV
jgi:hypothetical protein